MEDIKIKDIIISFRHVYVENLKKLNKRLRRHVNINSHLIKDVTLYLMSSETYKNRLGVKYIFSNKIVEDYLYNFCDAMGFNPKLKENAELVCNSYGEYVSNSKYISLKDQKIKKDIECLVKEEFFQNIKTTNTSNDIRISFSEHEISFSCEDFIICYNSVGDLVYSYSFDNVDIEDIFKRTINIDNLPEYHKSIIKKSNKFLGIDKRDNDDNNPGDYFIKENDDRILLKKLGKGKLQRYV